jgi:hypothetical protein
MNIHLPLAAIGTGIFLRVSKPRCPIYSDIILYPTLVTLLEEKEKGD